MKVNLNLSKIASILAFVIGAMAIFAGGKVLLGIPPGYTSSIGCQFITSHRLLLSKLPLIDTLDVRNYETLHPYSR